MKKKLILIIAIIVALVLVISVALSCAARFVFLAPYCYTDNPYLTNEENYFIKKVVLEAVEDRLSVFGGHTDGIYDTSATEIEIIQLDKTQNNRKHIFVLINFNFMNSVMKKEDGYIVCVNTYFMEPVSEDCEYEIYISNDYLITGFGLDP